MPLAVAFSTAGGYPSQPADTSGASWVDPNSGVVPNSTALAPYGMPANATGPVATAGYVAVPMQIMSAILQELRVQSDLANRNTFNYDLSELRADAASGATGGNVP